MRVWAIIAVLLAAACDSGSPGFLPATDGGGQPANSCIPGRVVQCFCAGGRTGIQACNNQALYDPCLCGDHPDTGPSVAADGGFDEAGTPIDGGFIDTGLTPGQDATLLGFDADPAPDANSPPPTDSGAVAPADSGVDTPHDSGVVTPADSGVVAADTGAIPVDAGFVDTGVVAPVDAGFAADADSPADSGVVIPADSGVVADAGFADAGTSGCTDGNQCPSGLCHPVFRQCIPPGQKLSCATCANDNECGLPGDECLNVTANNQTLERVCGQRCSSSGDCPRGFSCQFNNQCYPIGGSIRVHTCASLRDMLSAETCDSASIMDTCGIHGYADGTCLTVFNQCVVGCNTDFDCPHGSRCVNLFLASYCMP